MAKRFGIARYQYQPTRRWMVAIRFSNNLAKVEYYGTFVTEQTALNWYTTGLKERMFKHHPISASIIKLNRPEQF